MIVFGGNNHVYGLLNPSSIAYFGYETYHDLITTSDGHGSLVASVYTGNVGDTATLTYTPNTYYGFSGYTLEGGGSIAGNTYTFGTNDATAKAWFSAINYTITTQNDGNGTCTCNKNSVTGGETATLSNTPNTYYQFSNYSVTGGSVNGSTLTVTSNCTAKANFTRKTITFSACGHTNAKMYVTATLGTATTSWNTNSTATKTIPAGATIKYSAVANTYYRSKACAHSNTTNFTSARLSDPRQITGTCTVGTANAWVSTKDTVRNDVKWTWTYNNNDKPSWNSNNGGIYYFGMTPNTGRITINSTVLASSYCCRLLADSYSGEFRGATGKVTATTTAHMKSYRLASHANVGGNWSGVYQSAHVALTGQTYHTNAYWTGTATNGGQRGLKALWLINNVQNQGDGKNIQNNFFSMSNSTKTTSFNLTGAGSSMGGTAWNNQMVSVYATLGNVSNSTAYASKCPPNQITSCTATVYCTAIMP